MRQIIPGSSGGFAPSVECLVIGYWAQDGVFTPERHLKPHHNMFIHGDQEELLQEIIDCFSFDGQTVIDGISNGGILLIIP